MKNLSKKQIIMMISVIGIITIGIILYLVFFYNKEEQYTYEANYNEMYDETGAIIPMNYLDSDEQFVTNTKAKSLQKEKSFKNYHISNFKLIKGQERNKILLDIKNNSSEDLEETEIAIKLLDKNQNEIDTITIITPSMKANSSLVITGFTKVEVENIFDYIIEV